MKPSFLERYGSWIACGLVTLFAWRLISTDLHESSELQLLFPLYWLTFTPLSSLTATLIASFSATSWWMWAEIAFTVFGWMFVYFAVRGVFYKVMSLEGLSMWLAFAICIISVIAIFVLLVRPAFDQMAIWWSAWPAPALPEMP